MTAKKYLKCVRKEQKQLMVLMDIREKKRLSLLPKAIVYDRDKVQTSPIDKLSETVAEINSLDKTIERMLGDLARHQTMILEEIERLDNSEARAVMIMYYLTLITEKKDKAMIQRMATWEDVAERLYFSRSKVFQLHDDAVTRMRDINF